MHKWCKSFVLYGKKISGSSLDVTTSQKPFKWFVQDCLLRLMVVDAISSAASEDVCTWEWSLIILIDIGLASTFHWSQTPLALWCCHRVATRSHFADCALHGKKILWRVGGPRFGMLWHWLKGLALMVKRCKEHCYSLSWELHQGGKTCYQMILMILNFCWEHWWGTYQCAEYAWFASLPASCSSVSSLPRFESINLSLALQLVSPVIEDMTRGLQRIVAEAAICEKHPVSNRDAGAATPAVALCRSMLHITAYHRCPFGLKSQHGRAKCDEKSTVMDLGACEIR